MNEILATRDSGKSRTTFKFYKNMELEEIINKIIEETDNIDGIDTCVIRDKSKADHKGVLITLDTWNIYQSYGENEPCSELTLTKEDLETLLELANTVEL